MKTSMDRELNELGARLIRMGALCETAIAGAASCLQNREKEKTVSKKSKSRSLSWKQNKKNFQKLCLYLKTLLILQN